MSMDAELLRGRRKLRRHARRGQHAALWLAFGLSITLGFWLGGVAASWLHWPSPAGPSGVNIDRPRTDRARCCPRLPHQGVTHSMRIESAGPAGGPAPEGVTASTPLLPTRWP